LICYEELVLGGEDSAPPFIVAVHAHDRRFDAEHHAGPCDHLPLLGAGLADERQLPMVEPDAVPDLAGYEREGANTCVIEARLRSAP